MRIGRIAAALSALVVLAAPHQALAQNTPRVGWIWPGASAGNPTEVAGFKQGLRELGYVEGRNIVVEYRFGENSAERLPEFATELARLNVSVVVAFGELAVRAVQRAAPDTPIVFLMGDPIGAGLVTNLSRPGGNITGVSTLRAGWEVARAGQGSAAGAHPRRLPRQSDECGERRHLNEARRSAEALRIDFRSYPVERPADLESAFAAMTRDDIGFLLLDCGPSLSRPTGRGWRGSRSGTSSRQSRRHVNSRSRAA